MNWNVNKNLKNVTIHPNLLLLNNLTSLQFGDIPTGILSLRYFVFLLV